jgi:hypothetical protein
MAEATPLHFSKAICVQIRATLKRTKMRAKDIPPRDRKLHYAGENRTISEWCEVLHISLATWYYRRSKLRRGHITVDALFAPANAKPGRKRRTVTYLGETHVMAVWAQKLGLTSQSFANRMALHRSDPGAHPIEKVFAPAQDPLENLRKRRRRGPGKVAKKYQYTVKGKVFTHTANEWTNLLDLSRNTFYSRIRAFEHKPQSYPLSWVFRCKPNAPFANPALRKSTPSRMTDIEKAKLAADLAQLDADFLAHVKPAAPVFVVPGEPGSLEQYNNALALAKSRDKAFDQPQHGHIWQPPTGKVREAHLPASDPATEAVKPKLPPVTVLDFDD